ncbi:MAG: hypothetical protein PHI11_13455 [Gallionella sp.]|nr:hypothetical protein [Gallionella sp.]
MESEKNFFYSNGLELAVSPYDINLKFLRQGTPDGSVVGNTPAPIRLDEMTVSMGPALAKTIAVMLFKVIEDYEKNIGHIALQAQEQKIFEDVFGTILKDRDAT